MTGALKGAVWLGRHEGARRELAAYRLGEEYEVAHALRYGDAEDAMHWRRAFAGAYRREIERRKGGSAK